jgi:hypothetical protein
VYEGALLHHGSVAKNGGKDYFSSIEVTFASETFCFRDLADNVVDYAVWLDQKT